MKTRILTLTLTILIVLPLLLSSCAESEDAIEYNGEKVDQSYLNSLREKAGFAEDDEEQHSDLYDDEFLDKLADYNATNFDPEEWEEQKQEIFDDKLREMSESEMEEYVSDRWNKQLYTEDEIKELFAYAFQKGYEYGKNDIMDDTAKYYINNYNFTKQEINIYDYDWNFTDITVEVPTETKAPEATVPSEDEVYIVSLTQNVCRNEMASITIKGKPNTEYSISVIYNSGPSKAEGLETKLSDSDGFVSWTWKVGGKTAFGSYNIHIAGGGETYKTYFSVIEG